MERHKQEVRELIEKINKDLGISIAEIARTLGITEFAVRRWKHGSNTPTRKNFFMLKQIAEGQFTKVENNPPPILDIEELNKCKQEVSILKERVGKLEGFIEGLKVAQNLTSAGTQQKNATPAKGQGKL